jgi:hypothetical protein
MEYSAHPMKRQKTLPIRIVASKYHWQDTIDKIEGTTRSGEGITQQEVFSIGTHEQRQPLYIEKASDSESPLAISSSDTFGINVPLDEYLEEVEVTKSTIKTGKLDWRTVSKITALFVTTKNLDILSMRQRADISLRLLEELEEASISYGASVVEKRLDTCSFVLNCEDFPPESSANTTHLDLAPCIDAIKEPTLAISEDTVGRMLSLATDLHLRLSSVLAQHSTHPNLTMGMAWGSMTMLGRSVGSSWTACSALSVLGDAADLAEQMATAGTPGILVVHESALWRIPSVGRPPPTSGPIMAADGRIQGRGAVFDLSARAFIWPAAAAAAAAAGRRDVAVQQRLGKSASFA